MLPHVTEEWLCSSVSQRSLRIVQVGSPKGITLKEEQSGVPRAPAEEEKRNAEDKVTQK